MKCPKFGLKNNYWVVWFEQSHFEWNTII